MCMHMKQKLIFIGILLMAIFWLLMRFLLMELGTLDGGISYETEYVCIYLTGRTHLLVQEIPKCLTVKRDK